MARSRDIIKKDLLEKVKKMLDFFSFFMYNCCINKTKQKSMKGDNNESFNQKLQRVWI